MTFEFVSSFAHKQNSENKIEFDLIETSKQCTKLNLEHLRNGVLALVG